MKVKATYADLLSCNKKQDETWEEFSIRYNKIVDALNAGMSKDQTPYLHMSYLKLP